MKVWRSDCAAPAATDVSTVLPRLIEGMQRAKEQCFKLKRIHCSLQTRQLAIDSEGNVSVCCASYNSKLNLIGNYLQMPLREIEKRKNDSAFCKSCKSVGAHVYVLYLRNWKDRLKARMAHVYCGIRKHSI
jgi:hypothetical protein